MNKKILFPLLVVLALPAFGESKYFSRTLDVKKADKDLSFLVTFDNKGVNADFAKGKSDSVTMKDTGLLLRGLIGFDNKGAFKPEPGEKLRFNVEKNINPHDGTLIFWCAGLDYSPSDKMTDGQKRGNIALAHLKFQNGNDYLEYRLYEFADSIYFDAWNSFKPNSCGRAYASRKGIKKGQWHQIVCTWKGNSIALYLNGKLMKVSSLPAAFERVSNIKAVDNADSFIGIKSPFYEDEHKWGVGIDDFAVYNRAMTELEVKNQYLNLLKDKGDEKVVAYSIDIHGVNTSRNDKLDRIEAEINFAALSPAQQKLLDDGKLRMDYELKKPDNSVQKGFFTFKDSGSRIISGVDKSGKYTFRTWLDKNTVVVKEFVRPNLSWVGNGYGDEDEVPAIWQDFGMEEKGLFSRIFNPSEKTVKLWNRTYKFADGPLPVEITAFGKPVLEKLPELLIDGQKPEWKATDTKVEKRWITFNGIGKLGEAVIKYSTRVEFDGMMLVDWTISGQPTVSDMKMQWKMAPENHQFLMTPQVNESNEDKLAYPAPASGQSVPMLWFVSEKKAGFAFTYVNDANWVYNANEKVLFADKSTGEVKVNMITKKVKLPEDTPYRVIFLATPSRPLPVEQRVLKFGDSRGGTKHLINGGGNGGFAGIFHHAPHEYDFEYRNKGASPHTASVYGGIALTAIEPEAVYFRKYWEIPGAYSYNMPYEKPVGKGKYVKTYNPSISTCTSLIVNDFFLNSQHKLYNHKFGDRIWQVYYDLCGNKLCTSRLHGCRYKDKFGREVDSYEVLGERDLIRRTVAYAHKHGKTVMLHGQRSYFPMIQGLADYWFPGEQYNVMLRSNPFGYADVASDSIFRAEFNKHVLGIGVIHLPAIGQAKAEFLRVPEYTETMMMMLQSHDVDTAQYYAMGKVVQNVWDILSKYDVQSKDTICRLYHEQKEIISSNPDVRVTYYKTPGDKYVLFLANKTKNDVKTVIDLAKVVEIGNFEAFEEYKKQSIAVKDGKFEITVPARKFRIVCFPPVKFYPYKDKMDKWRVWKTQKHDTEFSNIAKGGINDSNAIQMTTGKVGGGCFMKYMPITPGKTYTFSIMAKKSVKAGNVSLGIQGRTGNNFSGAAPVSKAINATGDWQEIVLEITVPVTGKWAVSDNVLVTLGAGNTPNCTTIFDDFKVEEK